MIGMAFNTSGFNTAIKIGLSSDDVQEAFLAKELLKQVSVSNMQFIDYGTKDNCLRALQKHYIHACIHTTVLEDTYKKSKALAAKDALTHLRGDIPNDIVNALGSGVEVYLDYSRMSSAFTIYAALDNFFSSLKENILSVYASHVQNLFYRLKGMTSMKDRISWYRSKLNQTKEELISIRDNLNNKTEEVQQQLNELKSDLINLRGELQNYEDKLVGYRNELKTYLFYAETAKNESDNVTSFSYSQWTTHCGFTGWNYWQYISRRDPQVFDLITSDSNLPCSVLASFYYASLDTSQKITNIWQNLKQVDNDLAQAIEDIREKKELTYEYENKLDNFSRELISERGDLNYKIAMKIEEIENIEKDLALVEKDLEELDTLLENAAKASQPEIISNPLNEKITSSKQNLKLLDYALPIVIGFVVLLTSLLVGVSTRQKEINSKAKQRNYLTTNKFILFLSNYFFVLVVILLEFVLISLGFFAAFGSNTLVNFHYSLYIIILYATIWIMLSFILAKIIRNEQGAIFSAIILGLIFFLMSDVIIPLESFPQFMVNILVLNPYFLLGEILRQNYLFNEMYYIWYWQPLTLAIFALVLTIINLFILFKSE